MRIAAILHILLPLTASIALTSPPTRADSPPPASAFGVLPRVSDATLSPDGHTVAWLDQGAAHQRIVIVDLTTGKDKQDLAVPGDYKLRSLAWAEDNTLLFTVSTARKSFHNLTPNYEIYRTFALDIDNGKPHMLLMGSGTLDRITASDLVAIHTGKAHTVMMATLEQSQTNYRMSTGTHIQNKNSRVDAGWTYSLFEVDTRSGSGRRIEQGTAYTTDWIVDAAGGPVARSEWDTYSKVYTILARRDGGWHEIYRRTDGSQLELHGLTGAGSAIVAVGPDNTGRSQAWELPLDGSGPRSLLPDPAVQVDGVIRDGLSERAVGVHTSGLNPQVLWLDPALDKRQQGLEASFPHRSVQMVSHSEDNSRVLVRVAGPSNPPTYYLVNFTSHKADIVGDEYPELANTQLGKVEAFTYKARDGVEIPAFLTMPPHGADTALPLIVLVHGGPAEHDEFAFDWQTQFLATRGYAVLQPQFRGSTGYGEAFLKAGAGQWGRRMQDDVTDGVNALTASGKVDPHRVCIVGASYGGYAALAGAAFTPNLYACAVSINGISNLPDLLSYETNHDVMNDDEVVYWHTNIGSAVDPRVVEKSPVLAAGQFSSPVLLLYGADDTVVPPHQSEAMAEALSRLRKPVKLVKLAGEDHWLSHSEARVRVLQEMETFLAANLHP